MDIVYCETIVLYRDDRMLDRIHSTVQWTVNPWDALEDTERRLSLGLDWCLVCPILLNTNIMIIITTLMMRGRITKHGPDLFILHVLLTLSF